MMVSLFYDVLLCFIVVYYVLFAVSSFKRGGLTPIDPGMVETLATKMVV